MAITVAQAVAKIDADDSGLRSRFDGIKGKLGEAGGWFGTFGSTIAGVFSAQAIIGGISTLVHGLGDMVKEGEDANSVAAQTAAVLKSTHGAAGMTADAVDALSTKFMDLTGIDDDVVKSTENMLLTFTNIGAKGGVFDRATQTALDMSVALGQDTKNSAIQLGKALNDPVQGITALQRVGVTFNQTQKDLIATYMQHGDTAKAQGVILDELSKEFGGSAAAAGQANGGIKILQAQLGNMKETIGQAVIPILSDLMKNMQPLITAFAQWLPGALDKARTFIQSNVMPVVQRLSEWFVTEGLPALKRFGDFIMTTVVPILGQLVKWFQENVLPALMRFATFVFNNVIPVVMKLVQWFQAHVVPILQTLVGVVVTNVLPALQGIWSHISEHLIPAVQHLWEKLSPILVPVLQLIGWLLQNVVGPAIGVVIDILGGFIDVIADVIGKLTDLWGWIQQVFGAHSPVHSKGFGGVQVTGPGGQTKGFAEGGDVTASGMYPVGERGPELVYLPAGAHVYNANDTRSMRSGAHAGAPINVTMPIYIAGHHVADALIPDIVKAARHATGLRI